MSPKDGGSRRLSARPRIELITRAFRGPLRQTIRRTTAVAVTGATLATGGLAAVLGWQHSQTEAATTTSSTATTVADTRSSSTSGSASFSSVTAPGTANSGGGHDSASHGS